MDRRSFPMSQEEAQDCMSIDPIETDFYESQTVDGQIFPGGFTMDPAVYQQQYNLTTAFGDYTQTSSIDMTQSWPISQQQYLEPLSRSPVQPGLPPLVPRLSIAKSLVSDEGEDTSEPTSPRDEASERRKERRRAQNRAAQRAFRARKEDTIKESSTRLEALQAELIRLQSTNGNLSNIVGRLRSEIARLQQENSALRGRRTDEATAWSEGPDDEEDVQDTVGSTRASLDSQRRSAISFGLKGGMIGTVQWQDTGGLKAAERDEDKSVAESVMDAATALTRGLF